jgi:hypothetical protein
MKTELVLFGNHIDLASRRRRRWLAALVYAGLAVWIDGSWLVDRRMI